jgi:hypothetical protein
MLVVVRPVWRRLVGVWGSAGVAVGVGVAVGDGVAVGMAVAVGVGMAVGLACPAPPDSGVGGATVGGSSIVGVGVAATLAHSSASVAHHPDPNVRSAAYGSPPTTQR